MLMPRLSVLVRRYVLVSDSGAAQKLIQLSMFPSQGGDNVIHLCLKTVSEAIAVRLLGFFHASIRSTYLPTYTYLLTYHALSWALADVCLSFCVILCNLRVLLC